MASKIDLNPSICVILSISKASFEGNTSVLYASKVENDGSISRGNPFPLANKEELHLWRNSDISKEGLRVYDVIKYRWSRNKFVFIGKTDQKMVS